MFDSNNLPLEKRKIVKKTLNTVPLFFMFGLSVIPVYLISGSTSPLLLMVGFIAFVIPTFLVYFYQVLYYRSYYYSFEEEGAEIRKGVVGQSTGHVRYKKIQNVYVDQDVLDRIFGLYDVHYETAGETSGNYSHVDGLNKENADKLVSFLNNKLHAQGK